MNIYGITNQGCVRKQNQDAFYQWTDGETGLALVCDGMGGALAGNIASAMAAQRFVEVVSTAEGTPQERLLRAAVAANDAVYQKARQDYECWGMGTTLVGALARDNVAHVINIGDSRCYHLSEAGIRQVTRDHSLVEELVAMGRITPEEARIHPNKNIITRAIGTHSEVSADLFEVELGAGERLLFCSDGLSNEVEDEELFALGSEGALDECCDKLLTLTLSRGAHDNVTIVLMQA